MLEDIGSISDLQRRLDKLFDEQHRDALFAKDAKDIEQLPDHRRRETLRHLIHHHQSRPRQDCTSHGDHLLFATGESAHRLAAPLAQLWKELKRGRHVDVASGAVGNQAERVFDAQPRKQAAPLRDVDQAQSRDVLRRAAGDVVAFENDMALARPEHA